jgi:hypothetical protein
MCGTSKMCGIIYRAANIRGRFDDFTADFYRPKALPFGNKELPWSTIRRVQLVRRTCEMAHHIYLYVPACVSVFLVIAARLVSDNSDAISSRPSRAAATSCLLPAVERARARLWLTLDQRARTRASEADPPILRTVEWFLSQIYFANQPFVRGGVLTIQRQNICWMLVCGNLSPFTDLRSLPTRHVRLYTISVSRNIER